MSERLHELTPNQVVLAGAAPELFLAFKNSLLESLRPVGELEITLAEHIVVAHWGLRRCRYAETTLAAADPLADPLLDGNLHPILRHLDAVTRRHERTIERSLKLLRELQTEREFRRLATPEVREAAASAPLGSLMRTRRAFLAEQATKSLVNKMNLTAALDKFLNQPPPGSGVDFDRFK